MVAGIRYIERIQKHPIDKDSLAENLQPALRMFEKSVVARFDLLAGTVLEEKHLAMKKPGTGIPESKIGNLISRCLKTAVKADALISEENLE